MSNINQASSCGAAAGAPSAPTAKTECTGGARVGNGRTSAAAVHHGPAQSRSSEKGRRDTSATYDTSGHNTANMRILPLMVMLACVACQALARAQEDGEARAAPSRGLLKRGLLAKGKQTTTTTTPAPQEEVEYEDDAEYPAEGEAQEPSSEAPPSSTEGKKLVAGGVRPFRSNTDLLEALKRRRAQVAEAKLQGNSGAASAPQEAQTEAPVKSSYSKKRVSNGATRETNNEDAPASSKPSRGRFGRPAARSIQDAEPEEQNDAAPAVRNGRTFSRRGGN